MIIYASHVDFEIIKNAANVITGKNVPEKFKLLLIKDNYIIAVCSQLLVKFKLRKQFTEGTYVVKKNNKKEIRIEKTATADSYKIPYTLVLRNLDDIVYENFLHITTKKEQQYAESYFVNFLNTKNIIVNLQHLKLVDFSLFTEYSIYSNLILRNSEKDYLCVSAPLI